MKKVLITALFGIFFTSAHGQGKPEKKCLEPLGGAYFDGSDVILLDPDIMSTNHDAFSLEAWVKADISARASQVIIGNRFISNAACSPPTGGVQASGYELGLSDGNLEFTIGNQCDFFRVRYIDEDIRDGECHHVAVTRNASTGLIQLYLDGRLVGSGSSTLSTEPRNSAWTTKIGARSTSGITQTSVPLNAEFLGVIDEVRIWENRELSAFEVNLYRNEFLYTPSLSDDVNLAAYYPFDLNPLSHSGSLPSRLDRSGNHRNFSYLPPVAGVNPESILTDLCYENECCEPTLAGLVNDAGFYTLDDIDASPVVLSSRGELCTGIASTNKVIKKGSSTVDRARGNYYYIQDDEIVRYNYLVCNLSAQNIPDNIYEKTSDLEFDPVGDYLWAFQDKFPIQLSRYLPDMTLDNIFFLVDDVGPMLLGSTTLDEANQVLYFATSGVFGVQENSRLISVDLSTLSSTVSSNYPGILEVALPPVNFPEYARLYEIEFNVNGKLFGIIQTDMGSKWAFIEIDPLNGNWTIIQNDLPLSSFNNFVGSSTYDPSTNIYYITDLNTTFAIFGSGVGYTSNIGESQIELENIGCFERSTSRRLFETNLSDTNVEPEPAISLLPNPTQNGMVNLELEHFQIEVETEVRVYNSQGKLIFKSMINQRSTMIDLSDQSSGIYFVRVENQFGIQERRLFID